MPQVSSSAWDVPEGPQGSTPLGDWDPSAGLSRRPSLSPGDGTLRGGLLWAPGERRQVQASWSPRGGAPVPTWVIHTTPSVYLSHSLTPMGASASQQMPLPGPVSLPDLGIMGPELPRALPPRGLPGHPGRELPSRLCPALSLRGRAGRRPLCSCLSLVSGPSSGPCLPSSPSQRRRKWGFSLRAWTSAASACRACCASPFSAQQARCRAAQSHECTAAGGVCSRGLSSGPLPGLRGSPGPGTVRLCPGKGAGPPPE